MIRTESKWMLRARTAAPYPPRALPFPIRLDVLPFYQLNAGMAAELVQYCVVDDFLAAPAMAILHRYALPCVFQAGESTSVQLMNFTNTVASYNYNEKDARRVWIALNRVLGFVRVAAEAEELTREQIKSDIRDKANPFDLDFEEMRLEVV